MLDVRPQRREERKRADRGERRRDTVYVPSGRGSLYEKDEEERRRRRREQGEPVIVVYAEPKEPRRRKTYHR